MRMAVIAALILSAPAAAAQNREVVPSDRIAEALAVPYWEETEDWVDLPGTGMRMLIPQGAERSTFWNILGTANQAGISLRYRFDASAGRINSDGSRVEYPLCSLAAADAATFGDEAVNCPIRPGAETRAERLLAAGIPDVFRDPERARRTLGEALAARPALSLRGEGLARDARAKAAEILTDALDPGPAYDALLADALADYRRLAILAPDRIESHLSLATVLKDLGAYQEAMDIYGDIERRWPEESFRLAVATASLLRQQGEYQRALARLDDYARKADPNTLRMRFYYHRAWTLGLLDRAAEAITDIERGFASQPDYPSAYRLRACQHARLGQFAEALVDQERALALYAGSPSSAATMRSQEESRAAAAELRVAIGAARSEPAAIGCDEWERWSRPRARSPLVDASR